MGEIVYAPSEAEIENYRERFLYFSTEYGDKCSPIRRMDEFCLELGQLIVSGEAQIVGSNVTDGSDQANIFAQNEGVSDSIIIGEVQLEDDINDDDQKQRTTSIDKSFIDGTKGRTSIKNSELLHVEITGSVITDSVIKTTNRNVIVAQKDMLVQSSIITSSSINTECYGTGVLYSNVNGSSVQLGSSGIVRSQIDNTTDAVIFGAKDSEVENSTGLEDFMITNGAAINCSNLSKFNIFGLKLDSVIDSTDVKGGDTKLPEWSRDGDHFELSGFIGPSRIVFSWALGQPKQIHFT